MADRGRGANVRWGPGWGCAGSDELLNGVYRRNCIRPAEFAESPARSISPTVDHIKLVLDGHRARLHRDVFDAAHILVCYCVSTFIRYRRFVMTGQSGTSLYRSSRLVHEQPVRRI